MRIETITYTDFNGHQQTEKFAFNLTKAEILKLEATTKGGYQGYLQSIVDAQDGAALWTAIEDLVHLAYGKKSPDGRSFMKSKEILEDFIHTEAYSELIMKFFTDTEEFSKFVNGILPADLAKQVEAMKDKPAIEVVSAE
jgi:hypothetical protein